MPIQALKVLFLVYPFLGQKSDEAKSKYQRMVNSESFIRAALASVGQIPDIDFRSSTSTNRCRISLPMASRARSTNSPNGATARLAAARLGTLRQCPQSDRHADEVADSMAPAMEETGGDIFLMSTPFKLVSRRCIAAPRPGARDVHAIDVAGNIARILSKDKGTTVMSKGCAALALIATAALSGSQRRPTLKFGAEGTYPPFSMVD